MKLLDLDPNFVGNWKRDAFGYESHMLLEGVVEGAQGVCFQCPLCAAGKEVKTEVDGTRYVEGVHTILCWFTNPRNADKVPDDIDPGPGRWTFSGETLAELTLSPSVDLSVGRDGKPAAGCKWHGHVTNGEAA